MALRIVLLSLVVLCALAAQAAEPTHVAVARDLVAHLDLANTSYELGVSDIRWDGVRASHADCSGFVDGLLGHCYAYTPDDYKKWFDSHRPTAARYHDAIQQQRGFTQIASIAEARPGDLLAVKYLIKKKSTGHVMLVADSPKKVAAGEPIVARTEQWQVPVIDSSESGHGRTDTRHAAGPNGKDHQGLGSGILRVYADDRGRVVGFAWSTLKKSKFIDPAEEHLVIGRLVPGFKPQ